MPPWRDSLSEAERWSVALYTYMMSYDPEQIIQGQTVWNANCADCHGETGAGDGPRARELNISTSDLSRPEALIASSDASLFDTVTQGIGDAMPAFADTLSDAERWAVAAYVRTLSLDNADFSGQAIASPAATAEIEIASVSEVRGTISGQVTNATAGAQTPPDLVVTLHILDSQGNEETRETSVSAGGSFNFQNVPVRDDRGYVVTATYRDRLFGSTMIQGDIANSALELPFSIYELTDDRSVIRIDNFIVQATRAADSIEITQIMSFSNTSDQLYSRSEQVSEGRYASVVVPLPLGAQIIDFADDPQRYVFAENLTAVIDTRPVLPGANHVVHVLYTLPYQEGMTVDLPLEFALAGPVRLLAQPDSLSLSSDQLPALGTQTMGGTVYQTYGTTLTLPAGDSVRFTVNDVAAGNQTGILASNNLLPYVLIAVGSLSFLVSAALYYFGRRIPTTTASVQQLSELMIEQIAELDELHAHGQIDPKAYEERRNRLKARLAKLMNRK
jgi:cytochrome c553